MADYLKDGKIDQNAAYNRFVHIPEDIRSQVSEIAEKRWGKRGSNLYKIGMNFADFLWGKAISNQSNVIELAILGTKSAADTLVELRDRGVDSTRAYALSTVAGLAEVVIGIVKPGDALIPKRLANEMIESILKKTLTGGIDTAIGDILNWAADALYDLLSRQNESRWKRDIREKEHSKMITRKEAATEVLQERLIELGLDFCEGVIEQPF